MLLSALLNGVPVGIVSKGVICRVLCLGSCEVLERGGRLVRAIPSSDACILGERLECLLCFTQFPSHLKLSSASIWVACNGYAKGGHLVHFAPGINWPRGLNRRTTYIARARPNNFINLWPSLTGYGSPSVGYPMLHGHKRAHNKVDTREYRWQHSREACSLTIPNNAT